MRVPFVAGPEDHDRRLETVLRRILPQQSLGALHKALRQGDVRVNGAKAKPDTRILANDSIEVWDALVAPAPGPPPPNSPNLLPPLPTGWIAFEGDELLVVNKPSGLVVHRGEGPPVPGQPPLDERVRAYLAPGAGSSLSFRPGPLHRLDRETSGLVVFSKSLVGARTFSHAVATRQVSKTYLAVLSGTLEKPQEVRASLVRDEETKLTLVSENGQDSVSHFVPLAWAPGLTLVEVDLGTGRTHQIRAHAQSLGHPLAGDAKYGGFRPPAGLDVPFLLHAWKLSCDLFPPVCGPLPEARSQWLEKTFKIRI